jgi:hypothetical protein
MEWDLYFSPIDFPFHLGISKPQTLSKRKQKRYLTSPYRSFNSHNNIDAIGVPRGVPDEFKGRNQISVVLNQHCFGGI